MQFLFSISFFSNIYTVVISVAPLFPENKNSPKNVFLENSLKESSRRNEKKFTETKFNGCPDAMFLSLIFKKKCPSSVVPPGGKCN